MNLIDIINEGIQAAAKDPKNLEKIMCPVGSGLEMDLDLAIGHIKSVGELIELADVIKNPPSKDFMLNLGCLIQHQADVCEVLRVNHAQLTN